MDHNDIENINRGKQNCKTVSGDGGTFVIS